ncbi:MAG: TolC family protein, partial [Marinomonas gallaica]
MKFLISTCCALLLTGCASQKIYQTPDTPAVADTQYAYSAFTPDQWLSFGSPDLALLLEQAFTNNWNLKIATQRLRSAQLALDLERANQGVSASGSLSASQSTSTDDLQHYQSSEGLSFSARYEWDLWGKLQAQEDQTALSAKVSQWDLEAAQISLTANIIRQYFSYLATKERLAIAQKNLTSARESLELYTLQHDAGVVSKSDLLRQQSTILSLEERTETLVLQQADQARTIALLSGIDQWIEYAPNTLLSDINVP